MGRAETVLEQLTLKFGRLTAATTATVQGADSAQLRIWAARVLTAGNLDEVFE
ncbi:hypothetical protein GFY24_04045 [Nocardia sp. SYP-A9097]|uniref:hypothetical protein n=1 Tax=Nocardia sp. SYP-A9097 TaxID=2663237 RepID=UPI00129A3644|nr:hypothetical protein [Nocardia sp. SYP-A9097]MRH86650.1 hypothetical protein [Nocardia sp. SYP-A9097]